MKNDLLVPYNRYSDDDIYDYIEAKLAKNGIKRLDGKNFTFVRKRVGYDDALIAMLPPIDNNIVNLSLWEELFKDAFKEIADIIGVDQQRSLRATIVCPCELDNHWVAIAIRVYVNNKIIITIYAPHGDDDASCLNKAWDLLVKIIPRTYHDSPIVVDVPRSTYALNDTGVVVAEYVSRLFVDYPVIPDITESVAVIREQQVKLMLEPPSQDRERHYTRTNFLSRNTTRTRSIVLNKFLDKCERLNLDYSKTAFILVQHLIPQTIELIKVLTMHCQALPQNIFLLGKLYSTERWTVAQLRKMGINFIETNVDDYRGYPAFADKISEDMLRLVSTFYEEICCKGSNIEKLILLDDGGRLITQFMLDRQSKGSFVSASSSSVSQFSKMREICQSILRHCFDRRIKIAAIEQTSAGCDAIGEALLDGGQILSFPAVMMAASVTKRLLEPVLIAGQFWDKLQSKIVEWAACVNSSSDSIEIGIGIIGGGKIGQALIRRILHYKEVIKKALANKEISETDIRAKLRISLFVYDNNAQNMDLPAGVTRIFDLKEFVKRSRYIVGCTGRNVFADYCVGSLFGDKGCPTTVISSSSENKEFFSLIDWLKKRGIIQLDSDPLGDIKGKIGTNEIEILYGGYPFNFSGGAPAVHFQDIQSTLCMLFGGVLHAHYLADVVNVSGEGRGLSRLVIYDPFIQQTIIQLSIENIESLQRIFCYREGMAKANMPAEDLKFLQKILLELSNAARTAYHGVASASGYEFSQRGINTGDSEKILLGATEQIIEEIKEAFKVDDFQNICGRWLEVLRANYPESQSRKVTNAANQQLIPVHSALPPTQKAQKRMVITVGDDKKPSLMCNIGFFSGKMRISLATVSANDVTIAPDKEKDIPLLIEAIADPKRINHQRVHFWTTAELTVRSLAEIGPSLDSIIKYIKNNYIDKRPELELCTVETLLFMMDVANRFCAFYYRMGCIKEAVEFIEYANDLHNFIRIHRTPQMTEAQQQELGRCKRTSDTVHWFNIYLLADEYKKCVPTRAVDVLVVKNKVLTAEGLAKVQNFMEELEEKVSQKGQLGLSRLWAAYERLAAWYNIQGDIGRAIKNYVLAINTIDDEVKASPNKAHEDGYYRSNIGLELGELYLKRSKPDDAKKLFTDAAKYYKDFVPKELSMDETLATWGAGKVCILLGNKKEAIQLLQSVLSMLRAMGLERMDSIFVAQVKQDLKRLGCEEIAPMAVSSSKEILGVELQSSSP